MKHFQITLAILLFAALVAAGGYQLTAVNEATLDGALGTHFTADNAYTNEVVPMFAVSIDDAREDLVAMAPGAAVGAQGWRGLYWPYLINGIPVSLSINYDLLGGVGRATAADIRRIIAEFDSAGVAIEIVQHSNNNFSGLTVGAFTLQDVRDEINPANLIAATGRSVQTFQIPGDGAAFIRDNYWEVRDLLEEYGFKYANIGYDATAKQGRIPNWVAGGAYPASGGGEPVSLGDLGDRALFPGCTDDLLGFPPTKTMDLNVHYVERDYSITPMGVAPQRYDAWTMLADGDGTPADASWAKPTKWVIQALLAQGWGCVFSVHDSLTSTVAGAAALSPPQTAYDGQFSHHAFAAQLAEYRDAGLVRLGTMSDAYDWASKQYAPMTDLIPDTGIQFMGEATGDTVGVEYLWVAGFGATGAASATWTANTISNWTAASNINGKFDRAVFNPYAYLNAADDGWADTDGRIQTLSSGNVKWTLERTNMPLGRYVLSTSVDCNYAFIRTLRTAVGGTVGYINTKLQPMSYSYGDTLYAVYEEFSGGMFLVDDAGTAPQDRQYGIPFNINPALSGWGTFTGAEITQAGPLFAGFQIALESGTSRTCNWSRPRLLYLGKPR